jgi:hypothetical protein
MVQDFQMKESFEKKDLLSGWLSLSTQVSSVPLQAIGAHRK